MNITFLSQPDRVNALFNIACQLSIPAGPLHWLINIMLFTPARACLCSTQYFVCSIPTGRAVLLTSSISFFYSGRPYCTSCSILSGIYPFRPDRSNAISILYCLLWPDHVYIDFNIISILPPPAGPYYCPLQYHFSVPAASFQWCLQYYLCSSPPAGPLHWLANIIVHAPARSCLRSFQYCIVTAQSGRAVLLSTSISVSRSGRTL